MKLNLFKLSRRNLSLAACSAICGSLLLIGCGKNSPLNTDTIGNIVGGNNGQYIKAGGKLAASVSITEEQEDAMGQSVGVQLTSTYGLYNDPQAEKYVTLVGLTVASSSTSPTGNYVFGILDTPEVNAFSGPNGYVFITRGALAQMHDEAELAGVLGHEIAHVCHHDGRHLVETEERNGAIKDLLATNNSVQQFNVLTDAGIDAITKSGYTQPQEFDADKDGVVFMTAAGYDPNSYLHFLQRILQEQSGGGQVFSTHPDVIDRLKKVSDQINTMNHTGGATLPDRFARYTVTVPH
jgi:predicted Zn-dependent protease